MYRLLHLLHYVTVQCNDLTFLALWIEMLMWVFLMKFVLRRRLNSFHSFVFFSRTTGPILTKLGIIKHSWMEKGDLNLFNWKTMRKDFSEGDECNSNLVNICWQLLNVPLSRVAKSILTKLGINILRLGQI